jgi:hypothetical protein
VVDRVDLERRASQAILPGAESETPCETEYASGPGTMNHETVDGVAR